LSEAPLAPDAAKRLAQLVYAVMNSASLAAGEVAALKKDVAELLTAAGGARDRIQTVVFDTQAINESIRPQ